MTVKLTADDSNKVFDLEVNNINHTVGAKIFCRSSGLAYVDTETFGWNPIEYVKFNGEFGIKTEKDNPNHHLYNSWWHNRKPSRNGEFSYHYSQSATDTNKIFFYWDDLDNLPEVEYGCWQDQGLRMINVTGATIRLKTNGCGVGLWTHNCHNNVFEELDINDGGRGVLTHNSTGNVFCKTNIRRMGHVGFHLTEESSNNYINVIGIEDTGVSCSVGGLYFSARSHNNTCNILFGTRQKACRFWFIDGSMIFFEEGVMNNIVEQAIISDCYIATQDNSGMPGNRINNAHLIRCRFAFDQSDSMQNKMADPIEKILTRLHCQNTGPFGYRTPSLEMIPELIVEGEHSPHIGRWEDDIYPGIPGYEGLTYKDFEGWQGKSRWMPEGY